MPIYEYLCEQHGRFTAWSLLDERHNEQPCKTCSAPSRYAISAPRVFSDYSGYISPASGKWVEGRKARERDFAETGTRPYDSGEMAEVARRQAAAEREMDKEVDTVVEKTLVELKNG